MNLYASNASLGGVSPRSQTSFGTNPTIPQMPSPFSTNPMLGSIPPPSGFSMGNSPRDQPSEFFLEITRLLDMPMQEKMLSNDLKQYRVRAYDDQNGLPGQEIGATQELAGVTENVQSGGEVETETIRLGREGNLRVQTRSPVIHLQVEYAGGFFGNTKIGRCRIARADQRSKEMWPYALSNKNGDLVGCGIELKVVDNGAPINFNTMPSAPPSPTGASFQAMPPMRPGTPPGTGPPMMPPGSGPPMMPPIPPPMMMDSGSFATIPPGMMDPAMPLGMPPDMEFDMPPGSGPVQPSFHTIPPFDPLFKGKGFDPFSKGKGKGMPPMEPGMPPGSGPPQPAYQTMPPAFFDPFAKGKGKGMPPMDPGTPPGSRPMSRQGTPPGIPPKGMGKGMSPTAVYGEEPSFRTMPPQQMNKLEPQTITSQQMPGLQPEFFPNFSASPRDMPQVKRATQGDADVTGLVNQLIHANGLEDPTKGSTIEQIFGNFEELKVWGHGVPQRATPKSGAFIKDVPMVFAGYSMPPYDLRPLFKEIPVSGSFRQGTPVPVVAVVDVEKIVDIPSAAAGDGGEVFLTLEQEQNGKRLSKIGPFKMEAQSAKGLCTVNCKGCLASRVGMGDLAKGSVRFRVAVHYKGAWYKLGSEQRVGASAPFDVAWKPETNKYVALMTEPEQAYNSARPVGGIYISYRFAEDTPELHRQVHAWKAGPGAPSQAQPAEEQANKIDISGVSGKFKKGTQEEVLEYAALAVEAQNRALHQRINLAMSAKQANELRHAQESQPNAKVWRMSTEYRNWRDLDSVFITLGPNYVAQSHEVGPTICRVYEEDTSVWKELVGNSRGGGPETLGVPESMEEEAQMKTLVSSISNVDPDKSAAQLRPIIARDVKTIRRDGIRNAAVNARLSVKIHNAANLRTREGFLQGEIHPKVICEIPGKSKESSGFGFLGQSNSIGRWETHPAKDGAHIEWNQQGIIEGYEYGDDLTIKVVDKSWVGFEDHLGEARLAGSDFYPDSFFAQLPLINGGKKISNTVPMRGMKGASILIEVRVIEPLGKFEDWPPATAIYAPLDRMNESDLETQRLANWDVNQQAKLSFADVQPNYKMGDDIWGAFETVKSVKEGAHMNKPASWQPPRVKDECLVA